MTVIQVEYGEIMTKEQIEEIKEIKNYLLEVSETIEEMGAKIDSFEKDAVKVAEKRFKPEYNEKYYFIDSIGCINHFTWIDDNYSKFLYSQRNCFRTREEAKQYLIWLNIDAQIRDIADELNGDEVINWKDKLQIKYGIVFDAIKNEFERFELYFIDNCITCLSYEFLNVCLNRIGFDDLKFYFTYRR